MNFGLKQFVMFCLKLFFRLRSRGCFAGVSPADDGGKKVDNSGAIFFYFSAFSPYVRSPNDDYFVYTYSEGRWEQKKKNNNFWFDGGK